LLRNSHLSI